MVRRLSGRAFRSALCGVSSSVAILAAVAAQAAPVTQNYDLNFSSPSQAFWGPGQSAANFAFNQLILGSTSFGMRFETGASTGTVSSNYNGAMSVAYNDSAAAGLVPLTIGYQGDPNGGHFQTFLGAFVRVTAYFPVIGGVIVTNPNYSISTDSTYTPSPADTAADSGSFTPASTTIGPDIGVGSAQAGIDYDIVQNSTHTISALNGIARATHTTTGEVRTVGFSLGASDDVLLNLDVPGIWEIQLANLSLANLFSTDFDLAFVPFIQYTLGVNCGDPGTDSDNNAAFPFTGCISDGRLDTTLARVDLFSNTPFALALASADQLSSFQITVESVSSVPEPGTLALVGIALAGLALPRRRKAQ